MASSWLTLFLGVFFIQGILATSPIRESEADEEWIQFNELLRDPSYRLPTTTRPSRYAVTLEPYFENPPAGAGPFTFDGQVSITIQATQAGVSEIVMHCNDLTISELSVYSATNSSEILTPANRNYECEMPRSFLRIPLTSALNVNSEYIITSKFKGNLQTNMRGFYRSWYVDGSGNRRWMATTQFQPGHARQAFPCYDEPSFKARFDITLIRQSSFTPSISNMPIKQTTNITATRVSESFYTTPLTSTYLLAFIVSHYVRVSANNNQQRPFYIYARNNAGNTGDFSLEVGEKLLKEMEEYTAFPYYNMTENLSMQQAAIPDFSAGAMENWGLLTYREAQLLYDPRNSNHFYRQRIANIVAHEIAHMWFGNLVTCAWWDNLWLNEGFARFYQYFLTAKVAPEMGYETRFIVEQEHQALLSDSSDNAHALTNPAVTDPTSVSAHFSTITYAKGAAVLRMTQYLLGERTYRKALQNYLAKNAFKVAEPKDLFNALQEVATADNALTQYAGVTIEQYLKTWSEQAGHPLLTVSVNHTSGQMSVTQQRFSLTNNGVSNIASLWLVPITWTRGGAVDFNNLKPSQIISGTTTIINRGSTGREWVIFNKQQSGFYRVNYDSVTWALITQALRDPATRLRIHEFNRAQIVDDVFVMARAGVLSYTRAFNILSFLEYEDQYAPWIAAITGFNFARRRLAHNAESTRKLEELIIKLSTAVTRRLGFAEVANETYMDGLFRMNLNTFLCNVGHQQCIDAAKAGFASWRNNNTHIPANNRPWVYCAGLRHGTAADFDFFWSEYLKTDLANEQVVMLTAAGCTSNEASLQKFLTALTAGDNDYAIRSQDYATARNSAVNSNEVNTMRAFEWLKNNVNRTAAAFGSIDATLSAITSRLLTETQITEVSTWLQTNRAVIGESAFNSGNSGITTSRNNIQWYNRRVPEFNTYFENGFVDELGQNTTTTSLPTTAAPTTIAPTTESTPGTTPSGSPTIATFSFVTLLITLALNL